MSSVAFIGLGVMGAPMARHLIEAGHDVTVWNRTRQREEPLVALGAARAESAAQVAHGADAVLTCVSDDPDLEAVVLGPDGVPHSWLRRAGCSSMRRFPVDRKVLSAAR